METIKLNQIQKITIILMVACIGIILILHAPWNGYAYYTDIFDALTNEATTYWFAKIINIWIAITFVLVVGSLVVYLFRSPESEIDKKQTTPTPSVTDDA